MPLATVALMDSFSLAAVIMLGTLAAALVVRQLWRSGQRRVAEERLAELWGASRVDTEVDLGPAEAPVGVGTDTDQAAGTEDLSWPELDLGGGSTALVGEVVPPVDLVQAGGPERLEVVVPPKVDTAHEARTGGVGAVNSELQALLDEVSDLVGHPLVGSTSEDAVAEHPEMPDSPTVLDGAEPLDPGLGDQTGPGQLRIDGADWGLEAANGGESVPQRLGWWARWRQRRAQRAARRAQAAGTFDAPGQHVEVGPHGSVTEVTGPFEIVEPVDHGPVADLAGWQEDPPEWWSEHLAAFDVGGDLGQDEAGGLEGAPAQVSDVADGTDIEEDWQVAESTTTPELAAVEDLESGAMIADTGHGVDSSGVAKLGLFARWRARRAQRRAQRAEQAAGTVEPAHDGLWQSVPEGWQEDPPEWWNGDAADSVGGSDQGEGHSEEAVVGPDVSTEDDLLGDGELVVGFEDLAEASVGQQLDVLDPFPLGEAEVGPLWEPQQGWEELDSPSDEVLEDWFASESTGEFWSESQTRVPWWRRLFSRRGQGGAPGAEHDSVEHSDEAVGDVDSPAQLDAADQRAERRAARAAKKAERAAAAEAKRQARDEAAASKKAERAAAVQAKEAKRAADGEAKQRARDAAARESDEAIEVPHDDTVVVWSGSESWEDAGFTVIADSPGEVDSTMTPREVARAERESAQRDAVAARAVAREARRAERSERAAERKAARAAKKAARAAAAEAKRQARAKAAEDKKAERAGAAEAKESGHTEELHSEAAGEASAAVFDAPDGAYGDDVAGDSTQRGRERRAARKAARAAEVANLPDRVDGGRAVLPGADSQTQATAGDDSWNAGGLVVPGTSSGVSAEDRAALRRARQESAAVERAVRRAERDEARAAKRSERAAAAEAKRQARAKAAEDKKAERAGAAEAKESGRGAAGSGLAEPIGGVRQEDRAPESVPKEPTALSAEDRAAEKERKALERELARETRAEARRQRKADKEMLRAARQGERGGRGEERRIAREQRAAEREVARAEKLIAKAQAAETRSALAAQRKLDKQQAKVLAKGGDAPVAGGEADSLVVQGALGYDWSVESGQMGGGGADWVDHADYGLPEPLPKRR